MFKRFKPSKSDNPQHRADLQVAFADLLWPEGEPSATLKPGQWQLDLGLDDLVRQIAISQRYQVSIHHILAALTTDTTVIQWRQAILADFINNPSLVEKISGLLPRLSELSPSRFGESVRRRHLLMQTGERLAELQLYIESIQNLHEILQPATLVSRALLTLRDNLAAVLDDEAVQSLCQKLPELRLPFEHIQGLVIGINLDAQLRPESAVLLEVMDSRFVGESSLLERIIGSSDAEVGISGVAPLNYITNDPELRPFDPLYQDLDKLLNHIAKPIAQELARYTRISSQPLTKLEMELAFYVSAARLYDRLKAQHIPVCFPDILQRHMQRIDITNLHNVALCLKQPDHSVPSDAHFNENGRIAILTGPNSGGKTTYIRAVGLAQAMTQAGLFITAEQAAISPVETILTHFPALETHQQGRLAEEAERLNRLFQQTTRHCLILLNETFSSTSASEAVFLAQDVLAGLRIIGVQAIFATHLTELVDYLDEIMASVEGNSALFSLVAGIKLGDNDSPIRTFVIQPGQPAGRSYAQEIARQHGISLQQILEAHQQRNSTMDDNPKEEG